MYFRPTVQVELDSEDKSVKEIYIRGGPASVPAPPPPHPRPAPPPQRPRHTPPLPEV